MKTRVEIYSKEAADMLRNITTYHYMRHDQLLRLYPGKEEKIDNLLSFFLRQGRIFRDEHSDLYHDGTEAHADNEMLAALWVLVDFIDRVDYHSSTDFPVKLIFIADGELFVGLALDETNQYDLSDERIQSWCEQILGEMAEHFS